MPPDLSPRLLALSDTEPWLPCSCPMHHGNAGRDIGVIGHHRNGPKNGGVCGQNVGNEARAKGILSARVGEDEIISLFALTNVRALRDKD